MSFSRAHFSILTLPIIAAMCNGYSVVCGDQGGKQHLPLIDSRSSKTCSRGRDSASSLSIKKEYFRQSVSLKRPAPARLRSNLRGYPAASFEASLHNLLTWASLTRVPTHCTCEKTTVAISKLGSNVGWYASSLRLPLRSCMAALRGREWEALSWLCRLLPALFGRSTVMSAFCRVTGALPAARRRRAAHFSRRA